MCAACGPRTLIAPKSAHHGRYRSAQRGIETAVEHTRDGGEHLPTLLCLSLPICGINCTFWNLRIPYGVQECSATRFEVY